MMIDGWRRRQTGGDDCIDCCRLATLCNVGEDTSDITDIELIQHINVDCARLTKLLSGTYFQFVVITLMMVVMKIKLWCSGYSAR